MKKGQLTIHNITFQLLSEYLLPFCKTPWVMKKKLRRLIQKNVSHRPVEMFRTLFNSPRGIRSEIWNFGHENVKSFNVSFAGNNASLIMKKIKPQFAMPPKFVCNCPSYLALSPLSHQPPPPAPVFYLGYLIFSMGLCCSLQVFLVVHERPQSPGFLFFGSMKRKCGLFVANLGDRVLLLRISRVSFATKGEKRRRPGTSTTRQTGSVISDSPAEDFKTHL